MRQQGTVADLTQTLPAVISFTLPPGAPEPPMNGARANGAFHVETFGLQEDLYRLLGWASDSGVDLQELHDVVRFTWYAANWKRSMYDDFSSPAWMNALPAPSGDRHDQAGMAAIDH